MESHTLEKGGVESHTFRKRDLGGFYCAYLYRRRVLTLYLLKTREMQCKLDRAFRLKGEGFKPGEWKNKGGGGKCH